jgi:hypothetical protein
VLWIWPQEPNLCKKEALLAVRLGLKEFPGQTLPYLSQHQWRMKKSFVTFAPVACTINISQLSIDDRLTWCLYYEHHKCVLIMAVYLQLTTLDLYSKLWCYSLTTLFLSWYIYSTSHCAQLLHFLCNLQMDKISYSSISEKSFWPCAMQHSSLLGPFISYKENEV